MLFQPASGFQALLEGYSESQSFDGINNRLTYESCAYDASDNAYHKKFCMMKEFGRAEGLVDEHQENHPKTCIGDDRLAQNGALSKLELIKLWYAKTFMPMRHMYSWAVPSQTALQMIQKTVQSNNLAGVIEMGAGTGYWAKLLKLRGIDVVAFDKDINGSLVKQSSSFLCQPVPFHDIYCAGPEILKQCGFPSRALFLCYPPPGDEMCVQALSRFQGNFIVYAGALDSMHPVSSMLPECRRRPTMNGVETGHPAFFMQLAQSWEVVEQTPLPSHFFCRDHLVVLRRTESNAKAENFHKKATEIHKKLTPKWKALPPDQALDHVWTLEQKNWRRFEEEWLKYVEVHAIKYDPESTPLKMFEDGEDQMVSQNSLEADSGAAGGGCDVFNSQEIEMNLDAATPWKESLHRLMGEYPDLTTEKLHEKLVTVYTQLNKKTVKNARAAKLKLEKAST